MRYAQIRDMDISNGENIGVALFTQGCPFHCKDCFNKETWDYDGGYEWTEDVENHFISLIDRPYIKRVSFLGGEPLVYYDKIIELINKIKNVNPVIKIWLYSGYTYEEIKANPSLSQILDVIDILVDGRFETDKKDMNLKFRGSSNQRIINVKDEIK